MKTSLTTLLAGLLLPVALQAQYVYTTNSGALTITSFTGAGSVVIPSTANGLPVTSIGHDAFEDNFNLTSVVIPNSITNIGDEAFSDCYSMTSVTIGSNVLNIDNYAFQFCSKLTDVVLPASVTSIGLEVFAGCTALTNLTAAGQGPAFSSINGVLFDKDASTLVIYPQALAGPYVVPNTVTNIREYAFYQCTKLTSVTNDDNLLSIGGSAFSGCLNLTNVTLPPGLGSIGGAAFAFCTNVPNVAIPASVTNIQFGAFAECFSLTNITVANQNPAYSSLNGVAFDKNQSALIIYPPGLAGPYVVPGTVTSIDQGAFAYCTRLSEVTIPEGVTNIGLQAFFNCSSLSNAPLPNSLVTIGSTAFFDCAKLLGVSIASGVTSIGDEAFGGCISLTNAAIGNGVTNMGNSVFEFCSSLRTATIGNNLTNIGTFQFMNCGSLTRITIGDKVAGIGAFAFANCGSLTNLTFLGNAPAIPGSSAFLNINPAVNIYYQPGTTGWGTSYGGVFDAPVNVLAGILPAVLENVPGQLSIENVGVFTDQFGFTIIGASNEVVVVQVSSNLLNWMPLQTNTLPGTPLMFLDPTWRTFPARFYRLMQQ